jgi:phage terminase large subunit-like protein
MHSVAELLASKGDAAVKAHLATLPPEVLAELPYHWPFWCRENQRIPAGSWDTWLVLAGRGFGKTRVGAETVRQWERMGYKRIALVGATAADVRDVMIEGESGLLNVYPPHERPRYEPSKRRVVFKSGAIATAYSADEPERLRGPQHDKAWVDELCAWRRLERAWDMMQFGLRLGDNPQTIVTTTPKPLSLLRELAGDSTTHTTRGSTYDNKANLSAKFIRRMEAKYEGTRLGRQELWAEILDDVIGALWTGAMIVDCQISASLVPRLSRVVIAVDPGIKSKKKADNKEPDEWGIVAVGLGSDGKGYVLDDASGVLTPSEAGKAIAGLYQRYRARHVVAETNQGGDMVEAVLRAHNRSMRYVGVHATKGKRLRAEPVSMLYEQDRIRHIVKSKRKRHLEALEYQLQNWVPDESDWSPNRLDALVYGLTDLMLGERGIVPSVEVQHTSASRRELAKWSG